MKKLIIISGAAVMILCGCRATPDSIEENGVMIQQESILSVDTTENYTVENVPETWKDVWENNTGEMVIDAKVVVPEGMITQGHAKALAPDIERIKALLLPDGSKAVKDTDLETSYTVMRDGQLDACLSIMNHDFGEN